MFSVAPEEYIPEQITLVIEKILDCMEKKNFDKKVGMVRIYFSLDEIVNNFLDVDSWVSIQDHLKNGSIYREHIPSNTDDILGGLLSFLAQQRILKECHYLYKFENHGLTKDDERWEANKTEPVVTEKMESDQFIFYTKENIGLSVGWWEIYIPRDFKLQLLLNGIRKSKTAYLVGEKCIIDMDNSEILGEFGGKKLIGLHGGRKSKNIQNIESLIEYHLGKNQIAKSLAEKNLRLCSKDDSHELQKLFKEVCSEQIISFKNGNLRFSYEYGKKI